MQYISTAIQKYLDNYRGLPKTCWQGSGLILIESFAMGISFFLSLYFVNILRLDSAAACVMISYYGIGTVLGGTIIGFLSDKFSCKKLAISSLIFQIINFILLAELRSFIPLAFNLFILGIMTHGFMTTINVWMLNQCKEMPNLRLRTVNISRAALNAGFGLSGIMIGLLARYHFKLVFYTAGFLLFMALIYLIFADHEEQPIIQLHHESEKKLSGTIEKKILGLILICLFLTGLIISQLSSTYPLYIQEAFPSLGVKAVSILFMLDTILILLFQAPLVNSLNSFNKILLAGIGAFLMGLGMLVLSFSFSFAAALISCAIWTTGEMIFIAMAQLICYERSAQNKKGQGMGLYQSVYASTKIIGPALGGYIYYRYNGNLIWTISAFIGLFCFISCFHFKKYA